MGAAGERTEPYPDVVLPVVSLLEFLRRVGKSLQSKGERRNELRESKRTQALPTAAQEHGCCPNTQHPCSGVPAAPCHPCGCSRDREPVFPACSCLSWSKPVSPEEFLPLELNRPDSLAAVVIPVEQGRLLVHRVRADPRSLH